MTNVISRRNLFGMAGALGLASLPAGASQYSYSPNLGIFGKNSAGIAAALDDAYSFLDLMMDAYAQGQTLRLIQSYSDQQGLESTAFTYDNAVVIAAFLVRSESDDIARAEVLGNSLLYAQQNNTYKDGRLFDAYFVNTPDPNGAYIQPATGPFYFTGSATGNMAWAGMALCHLYHKTHNSSYLRGATKLGNWIYTNAYDTRGAGGYTGGVDNSNNKITYKATEHNIDVYAFFNMLANETGNSAWTTAAQWAAKFVASMWNSTGGFFWTGTGTDGVTTNTSNIPEDVQTWSYLAFHDNNYAASLDWVTSNLITIDTPQTINSKLTGNTRILGETFASLSLRSPLFDNAADPNAVWLEGTAHTADALLSRDSAGDIEGAFFLLENIRTAQRKLGTGQTVNSMPIPAGKGIIAASSVLDTGFGYSYFPNLHIGATGWSALAAQLANPFHLHYHGSY
jgi:uncharacterized protein YyaL (SSP411 family)